MSILTAEPAREPCLSVPRSDTVVAGFELQVDLAPHGLAVRSEASTWSYAELDARANAVAHLLLGAGALSGRPVAIVLPTGAEVIAAILGVLKAGGIYVVLDPGHPRTRNEHIASDASPAVFLTNQAGVAVAQEIALPTTPVLLIEHAARARTDRPGVMILPDDPAWLIYTSGSTGRPKGVVQSHRHAVHNVWRQQRLAQWSPSDRMTWLYSPGVMGATRGLTAALLHGASLFPRDPRQESPATFIQWLRDERITVYHSVASLFRNVFGLLSEPASLPEVRLAIFGGERVGAVELDLLRRHLPADARVYTGLGTTETGTVSHVLVDPVAAGHGPLPLGRPVEGVTIELRDENGGRIPPGGVGEIVVASEHLALRYWREPAGLRPAFAPDPLHPQVRVYRTGDLGRFDGDGMLRHAGRKDFQVKIRGFRVEVAEIEFALQDHPGVNEAAVVGRPDAQGECRLAAYCVARSAPGPAAGELRRFLEARLPRHLVPTTFAVLAGLPRTPNGKLDRLALPDGVEESGAASDIFVAPQGSMEQKLAAIWTGVLGRARVSRHDDFFALGGHSLAAMQVAARIGAEFDIDLAPREIFASPVLSDLAMRVATVATGPRRAAHQMLLARPPGSRPCLSFAQESLWFIDQLEPRSPTYHIVRAFQIRGPIDLPALDRALQTIVSRHEPLRTVIELVDGAPRARLRDHEVVPLRVVWHRGDPAAFVAAESARPFDLSADLLLRAAFGRNGDGGVLVLTLHHVAGDAWSVANILREMSVLYTGFSTGSGRAELPPLAVSYSDFAAWQRGRLAPPDLEREVAFWRRTLASAPPLLELPCDFPRPSQSTGRAAVHRFAFPAATAEAMEELATHGRVTPFVVWLAAFQVLLSRHAGVSDVVVAAPVSGRSRVELEPLIGFFVDTLLFRGDLSGDPGFADFVARLGRHATEVFAHGDLPFAQLVQALQPERTGTQAPLAQVMFAWQNAPRAPLELGSAEVTPLETSAPGAKFDLTLVMEGTETGLRASFEYRSDLFHPTTITRLARRFTALVQGILAEPGTPCHRLPLLPEAEMRQLDEWSGADATLASPDTVRAGWARQVARTPAAIALRAAGEELSYAELDAAADRVASHLLTLGVQRGDRVALAVGRRLELGAAMLGAWKVGAAFVPLDPSYPRSRLEFMLSDSGTRVIIAPAAASAEWRPLGVPVLEMELAATRGEPARPVPLQPEDLAYVIYTSGSTGRPKGVPIPHRALWQHHQAVGAEFALGPGDRVLQFSALSFDASLEEIFPTWLHGGTVVLRDDAAAASIAAFVRLVEAERITVLNLPTAFWRELVEGLGTHRLPPIRLVVIGGEKAAMGDLRRWRERIGPHVRLLNTYGPTEATITATVFDATSYASEPLTGSVPIGRPTAGNCAEVLDRWRQPVPIGVWGELALGGVCLTRGYWQNPETTAAKFVPDPRRGGSAQRYLTGDIVRWSADGVLEFRGRLDEQVKWRGFRIELGEVEQALLELPGATAAAASLRPETGSPASGRLVGYVVPASSLSDIAEVRARLRQRLPAFAVPSDFVGLTALPLTPGGKLDRAALPAPAVVTSVAGRPATFSPLEARVREVWQEVLGGPVESPEANFFAMGGHSLLAVRVSARLEAVLGQPAPLATLFTAPTLRQFAATLTEAPIRSEIVTLKSGSQGPPLVCVPGGGAGLEWGYRALARHFPGAEAIWLLPPEPAGRIGAPDSIAMLARLHLERLRARQPHGPYHLVGYCFGGNVAYEMARQLRAADEEVGLLAVLDTAAANSNYYRVRLTPRFLAGFSVNLCLSVAELAALPRGVSWRRVRSLVQLGWRAAGIHLARDRAAAAVARQEAELDLMLPERANYPAQEIASWQAHLAMIKRYHPEPAALRIVLFRTRRRPLWRSHEPTLGWVTLAREGVTLEQVPGTHGSLFHEPFVGVLARRLAAHVPAARELELARRVISTGHPIPPSPMTASNALQPPPN